MVSHDALDPLSAEQVLSAAHIFLSLTIERQPYGFGFGFCVVGLTDAARGIGRQTRIVQTLGHALALLASNDAVDVRRCCRCRRFVNLQAFQTTRCGVNGGKNTPGHIAWRCPPCERERVREWYQRRGRAIRRRRRGSWEKRA